MTDAGILSVKGTFTTRKPLDYVSLSHIVRLRFQTFKKAERKRHTFGEIEMGKKYPVNLKAAARTPVS